MAFEQSGEKIPECEDGFNQGMTDDPEQFTGMAQCQQDEPERVDRLGQGSQVHGLAAVPGPVRPPGKHGGIGMPAGQQGPAFRMQCFSQLVGGIRETADPAFPGLPVHVFKGRNKGSDPVKQFRLERRGRRGHAGIQGHKHMGLMSQQ